MEDNVQKLLNAEKQVNKNVQQALADKNVLLKSVKARAEENVAEFKKKQEATYQQKLQELKDNIAKEGESSAGQGQDIEGLKRDYAANK
jgi:vacuolar-type H+-ATPase subunit H